MDELADYYNKDHFPFHYKFHQLSVKSVKKTMQHDTTSCLMDNMIIKTKTRKQNRMYLDRYSNKPTITYTITDYGRKRLSEIIVIH